VLTRDPDKWTSTPVLEDVDYVSDLAQLDTSTDWYGVINLAGEPLNQGRWNASRKQRYRDSRVDITSRVSRWTHRLDRPPEVLISASAIGWYGHWEDQLLDESSGAHDGFSHQLCRDWEAAATDQPVPGCRSCVLRIGLVLGVDDGPLLAMLMPARLGLGGPMGSGAQWWSWIHIHDLVRLFHFLLENDAIDGPVNATAPNPTTQKQFAKTLGRQLGRPALLPMPGFLARWILGEFAHEVLLNGQRVIPTKSLRSGFEHHFPELAPALNDLLA
jgi:uncharacterized protein (TIGR01777 family)